MKNQINPQMKISIILIFLLITGLSVCVSSRITTSGSDIPVSDKYYYVIHGQNLKYQLNKVEISDGVLSGKINLEETSHFGSKVHIFIIDDSATNINVERVMSIPLDNISQVEIITISSKKTLWLVLGSTIGIVLLITGICFHSSSTSYL